jgi:hypothetical protein
MSVELLDDLTEEMLPRVLPPGWRRIEGNKFLTHDGMSIIASAEHIAGERWWHVSMARQARLPSWDDLRRVKDVFIGKNRQAVSVLPDERQYVNHHPFCLHLWCNLDRDLVPDMRREGVL